MKKAILICLLALLGVGQATWAADNINGKLSRDIRQVMMRQSLMQGGARASSPVLRSGFQQATKEETICAFVRFSSGDAEQLLAKYGCEKVTQIGDIYIANIPVAQIAAMAADDAVERIETQTGGRMLNDLSPQWTNTTDIYAGTGLPQAYDGKGVLLGIIDGGFDMTHPSLYALDGKTYRVKGFVDDWADENETLGVQTPLGREYLSEADILGNLHVGDTLLNHGAHTLGTAAGSGYGSPYRGVAYGADIFAISTKSGAESYANSADQTARMKRIFDYADQKGQPCVISYSIGFNDVPGDAQLFSEALQTMLGPGRILVAAAGNIGRNYTYLHKPVGVEAAGAGLIIGETAHCYLVSEQPFRLKCMSFKLSLDLITKNMKYVLTDSLTLHTETLPTDSVEFRGHHIYAERITDNGQSPVYYRLFDRWEDLGLDDMSLLVLCIEDKDADVQMYARDCAFVRLGPPYIEDTRFLSVESSHNIDMPGSLAEAVTVGALNGRPSYLNAAGNTIESSETLTTYGTIAAFSSKGPTLKGITKPDVVAPGVNIISAGNSYCPRSYGQNTVAMTTFNGHQYPWIADSGTSMATPCVAGIVALWLQADPTLTPDRIKDIISKTSQQPVDSLDYPNNIYGHGLIDAYAGMLHVLGIPVSIPGISTHQPTALRIRTADGNTVRLTFDTPPTQTFNVSIYTVSGQLLSNQHIQPHGSTCYDVALPHQPRGTCVVQVNSYEKGVTGSELLQF